MVRTRWMMLACAVLCAVGCDDDGGSTGEPVDMDPAALDGASPDGANADGAISDADLDMAAPDVTAPDVGTPDMVLPDLAPPDEGVADAMLFQGFRTCQPPCPVAAACDGHLTCLDGACAPIEPMQCPGGCADGACAEPACDGPPEQCAGPLAWLLDVVRYEGETASLQSAIVAGINAASDRVFCRDGPPSLALCVLDDFEEDDRRRECAALNVSRAQVEGELAFIIEQQRLCSEFTDVRQFELTAAGYTITAFGAQAPTLQVDGRVRSETRFYYGPLANWSLDLAWQTDAAGDESTERPPWARPGRVVIEAAGRATWPIEFDPASPTRSTAGEASIALADGSTWTARWDVLWQSPYEDPFGEVGRFPGCLTEPWRGEAEVRAVGPGGAPATTWSLVFDGEAAEGCDGEVGVSPDGEPRAPVGGLRY